MLVTLTTILYCYSMKKAKGRSAGLLVLKQLYQKHLKKKTFKSWFSDMLECRKARMFFQVNRIIYNSLSYYITLVTPTYHVTLVTPTTCTCRSHLSHSHTHTIHPQICMKHSIYLNSSFVQQCQ